MSSGSKTLEPMESHTRTYKNKFRFPMYKKIKNYNVSKYKNFDPNNHMSNSYVANYQEDKSRKAIVIMICEYAN